jgi:RNA polymerase sigma factor (sigma-70 family)
VPPAETVALYMQNRDELLNYAARIVRDRASAEDIVQEAWLRFSERMQQGGEGGEVGQPLSYLYAIVRNLALNLVRRAAMQGKVVVPVPEVENVVHDAPSAEQVLYYKDELRVLADAIAELPERTQIAFRMYKIESRPLHEIAARLDISVPRAHQLVKEAGLHAARRLLGDERSLK